MSFDVERAGKDKQFWEAFTRQYGGQLIDAGWEGPLEAGRLEVASNWDAFSNVLSNAVPSDGEEVAFEETDGGGIPGSADFAAIQKLFGKFFVTGSYMDGGPYDSLEEAESEAGMWD